MTMTRRIDIGRTPGIGAPRRTWRRHRAGPVLASFVCLAVSVGPLDAMPRGDGAPEAAFLSMSISPDTIYVAPGESFLLELRVDVAGKKFNAYDAVVAFDTLALASEVPAVPREGEGALMKDACGNTFHRFAARGDSMSISHVILCGGVTLTGPGTLHLIGFRALKRAGITTVRLRRVQFYDAGLFTSPARTRDAVVIVTEEKSADVKTGQFVPDVRPDSTPSIDVAEQCSERGRYQG
jgi:hypothetical protein